MGNIPGRCKACGAAVEIRDPFGVSHAEGMTLDSVTFAGSCPKCGGDVRLIDGTFNVVNDVISIVRAPRWTIDTLEELKSVLESARRDLERGRTNALSDVARVSPESAGLILRALRDPAMSSAVAIISALVAAIGLVIAFMTYQLAADSQRDIDQQIREEVHRVFEQQADRPAL